MHPLFVAMGPGFKKGVSVETFHTVDIYPLMCQLLDLDPAPNNGSLDTVQSLLVEEYEGNTFVICKSSKINFSYCQFINHIKLHN